MLLWICLAARWQQQGRPFAAGLIFSLCAQTLAATLAGSLLVSYVTALAVGCRHPDADAVGPDDVGGLA